MKIHFLVHGYTDNGRGEHTPEEDVGKFSRAYDRVTDAVEHARTARTSPEVWGVAIVELDDAGNGTSLYHYNRDSSTSSGILKGAIN